MLFFLRIIERSFPGTKISSRRFAREMYGILIFSFSRTLRPADSWPFPPSITIKSGMDMNDLSILCLYLS